MFIVFEGQSHSGKTTLHQEIHSRFLASSSTPVETRRNAPFTREERIKYKDLTPDELMIKMREKHINTIIMPALENKEIVLLDRFYHMEQVYFGYCKNKFQWFYDREKKMIKPDIIFYLDVAAEEIFDRMQKDPNIKTKPTLEELKKVEQGYKKVISFRNQNFVIINTKGKTIKELTIEIWDYINKYFNA